jgi:hypothetical protein
MVIRSSPADLSAVRNHDLLTGYGLFLNDTNSDGVADGWTKITNAAYSITTDADGTKWQTITRDSSSAGALMQISVNSAVNPGDVVEIAARVRTSGWDAAVTPTSTLNWTLSCQFVGASLFAVPAYSLHCDLTDGVVVQRVVVGAGATGQIKVNLQIFGNPASGSVMIQFGNVTVRNLTALGVL